MPRRVGGKPAGPLFMSNDSSATPRTSRPGLGSRVAAGVSAGVSAGGAAGYYYARGVYQPKDAVVLSADQAEARDEAMRQQAVQSRYTRGQLDTADGELVIERSARQEL
ncbi:hypothetical protein OY671_013063, partial [Metschnikowia pulcherrima]